WSTKLFDEDGNRPVIKRLISIDRDSASQELYKYWLYIDYLFEGRNDSSLIILDELIDETVRSKSSTKQFSYEYEKMGALEELGHYDECLELADKFLEKAPGNSIEHYIHLWKSLALFNRGDRARAINELGKADSCAASISEAEKGYYNSFAYVLNTVFDFEKTGRLRLFPIAKINNQQKDNLFRTQYLQQESEQNALISENRRLSLKAKSERQTAAIIIIILVGLLITGLSLWYALNRRRKSIEAEEQAEALSKMVEELKTPASPAVGQDSLRRTMLQQLGIIKMVAETPTEQNREMLRKISSIDSDTKGALVNWGNVFEIIDNLYSGFYTSLHDCYGNVLSDKEEQIIVLMLAGFSTKEISVITSQTTATIYVRKSSVRKKLGVPEKEDIVAFLRQSATV
ncbi:MAG: LuxR C-terminal-related transcriptional regulator, partial [Duncaniella sp.]|nr:LuxR C-terminal-related transcriptional regulator [Duncaniella sp.]